MIIYQPIPVLFQIGPLKIYSWGLMFALALLLCFFIARRMAEKRMKKHVENIFLLSIIAGLFGARIGWVLLNLPRIESFLDALRIWQGGLVSYAGIASGLVAAFIYIRIKKLNFLEVADFFAPYMALGFALGRIGCFFNWCCYGKPSMFKLALWVNGIPRHATQLYLSIGNLIIFAILFYVYRRLYSLSVQKKFRKRARAKVKQKDRPGLIFFLFLLLYSALRFFTDFLRAYPSPEYFAGLALSQWTSMLILFISLFCILIRKR